MFTHVAGLKTVIPSNPYDAKGLLIAAIDPALHSFSVVLAEKSTTRLGERDPDTGDLSADARI